MYLYFKLIAINSEPDATIEELRPVKTYAEECMRMSAEKAVRLLGEQGGFINIPLHISSNPSMYVNPDGLGILKMPFWFYKGNKFSPTTSSIEMDISQYIDKNLDKCLNDFSAFPQYKIIELANRQITTSLNKEDVSINMDYPLRIIYKSNSSYANMEKFSINLPVRLKRIVELGNQLLDSEVSSAFLENFTMDLMASNPDVPFTDMVFSCQPLQWKIQDVQQQVEDMLYYNLPRIRIKNTNYLPYNADESKYQKLQTYHMEDIANGNFPKEEPNDSYEYLHMFYDIGIPKENNINIAFNMAPNREIEIVGRPNDNGVLRSDFAQGNNQYTKFLCVNIYHFIYDVNYPVIVTLYDPNSFNGNGYIFNYAMPVTIHNNEPYKQNYGYELFTTTYQDTGFCDTTSDKVVDIRAYGKDQGYSNMELKDVNISMQCFKYFCPLGSTKADEGIYRLRTNLPAGCTNPFIIGEKEGYLKSSKQYTGSDVMGVDMIKLDKLDYKVKVHRYNSIGQIIESAEDPADDMNVSIEISSNDFDQYKIYPVDSTDEKINKLELVDGDATYKLNIVLMQGDEFVGGYNGVWNAKATDIAGANEIVFHVIQYDPMPYTKEEKLKMMDYIMNGNYKEKLKPELLQK